MNTNIRKFAAYKSNWFLACILLVSFPLLIRFVYDTYPCVCRVMPAFYKGVPYRADTAIIRESVVEHTANTCSGKLLKAWHAFTHQRLLRF